MNSIKRKLDYLKLHIVRSCIKRLRVKSLANLISHTEISEYSFCTKCCTVKFVRRGPFYLTVSTSMPNNTWISCSEIKSTITMVGG